MPVMKRAALGWSAVGMSTVISSLWAFWGVFESFHEGWYFESLPRNLVLTARYLTLMLVFIVLSVIAIRWPRGGLYSLFGIAFCVWILMTREALSLGVVLGWLPVTLPPLFIGALFWVGRPRPASLGYKVSLLVPLAVAVGFAVKPVARIAGRLQDGHQHAGARPGAERRKIERASRGLEKRTG